MGHLRSSTLGLFYFCKYAELIFLTVWTVLMIGSGAWLMQKVGADQDFPINSRNQLMTLIPVCMVLAVFNIFYNNLLFNLRFSINLKSRTAGICLFKYVNWLFCSCVLEKPCKDRCFTPWTIGKWVVKAIIFGYTLHVVKQYHNYLEDTSEGDLEIETQATGEFDTYLLVYILQHVIFIVARIPIYLLFSIFTCCCDKGELLIEDEDGNVVDEPKFRDRIISYDYIKW